jgi:hypothetical protein
VIDEPDPGPPATLFSIGEWLAQELGCPLDDLVRVDPASDEPASFETWLFARTGTEIHGAIVITHARRGVRIVTAIWGADGMANAKIGADDVVRW